MDFKEYLKEQNWNSFATYPPQMHTIYLYCYAPYEQIHTFLKIERFNAVLFNPEKIKKQLDCKAKCWEFMWLPIESIDESNNPT